MRPPRATLRARKKALRRQLAELRAAGKSRLRALERSRPRPKNHRRRRLLLLLLLLLLALFLRCSCEPGPPPPPPESVEVLHEPAAPPPTLRRPLAGGLARRGRANYDSEPSPLHGWLNDFRIQVTARSTRLADCFRGSDRPGALRWTCSVTPGEGAVADHAIEPLGGGGEISKKQLKCLTGVLTSPPYTLRVDGLSPDARSTPSRVGMVIEF